MHRDKATHIHIRAKESQRARKSEREMWKRKRLYAHNCSRFFGLFVVRCWAQEFYGSKENVFLFISYCRFCVSLILTSLSSCFAAGIGVYTFFFIWLAVALPFSPPVHDNSPWYFAQARERCSELIRFALLPPPPTSSSLTSLLSSFT